MRFVVYTRLCNVDLGYLRGMFNVSPSLEFYHQVIASNFEHVLGVTLVPFTKLTCRENNDNEITTQADLNKMMQLHEPHVTAHSGTCCAHKRSNV